MKAIKVLSLLTAVVVCTSSVPAVTVDEQDVFKAQMGLVSSDLGIQSWTEAEVGMGDTTLTCTLPRDEKGCGTTLQGIGMLVVDLEDFSYDMVEVRVGEILADGKPLDLNETAVVYGAEDGGSFRIELFSIFGETADNPPFDPSAVTVSESLSVKLTLSEKDENEKKEEPRRSVSGKVAFKDKKTNNKPGELSVKITLSENDSRYDKNNVREFECTVDGDSFSAELESGVYDITISSDGYVTREMKGVAVGTEDLKFADLDLRKRGDVSGDGVVNVADITMVVSMIKGAKTPDSYQKAVADCTGDNKVNVADISSIVAHIKGTNTLQ